MIVEEYFRGARAAYAHPAGCQRQLRDWIDRVRTGPRLGDPQRVLVVGSGGGLGLAARVASAFGRGSATVGVSPERPGAANRPGTAGWYRCLAFERAAAEAGLASATLVGDGFADTVKQAAADLVAERLGQLDLLVYSVAAPRRHDPRTGRLHASAIKAIGEPVTGLDYDLAADAVVRRTMPVAGEEEIADTVKVMGGEDFAWWVAALRERGLLATGVRCLTLSYVGVPQLAATYRGGTLGRAKQDLEDRTRALDAELRAAGLGSAEVAVPRALVTQASTAIPLNTLYTMLLLQVLAECSVAEDVLDQGVRLVAGSPAPLDPEGRRRLDGQEQRPDVQAEIWRRWQLVADGPAGRLTPAVERYRRLVRQLYGFGVDGVDYRAEVDPAEHCDRLVPAC
ncbi:bifunctional NADH-specific enoyl-ACP reductase/trans-2-enoyl-CoA reductase [Jatrophihabitans sp.]|uniref:bifunctional NADH-specific enoyl-ACP reductase/trans-2-enoyl-CoA reductase n=1 Tax=Jatrophihabitans sp. TaxID=1932789 RepID=UPI002D0CDA0A|nr:bifunctional NADH-specific enoyl-ACP reductase/trans-2-enoyl-CoA reductase [Jatrophihabitans sp.]